jgi:tRNA(Ile)-lysidine synthase
MFKLVEQFEKFVKSNALFMPQDKILLAVSGGKDSVAMVHLFLKSGFNFGIAHCNFQLRKEESIRDQNFVVKLAERLKVPIHVKSFDTEVYAKENQLSIQMAARELRYAYFEEIKLQFNYQKIAVAQHQNDSIETIMLNLIRGTGISGLHGIKAVKDNIIRPLICFTGLAIENWITENNIDFVEDSSNASTKYARNKIRLDIIPKMKQLNPSLEETFQKNIAYFSQLENLLEDVVTQHKQHLFAFKNNRIEILKSELDKLQNQDIILYELFRPFKFNLSTIKDLVKSLNAEPGRQFESEKYIINVDRIIVTIAKKDDLKEIVSQTILNQQTEVFIGKSLLKINTLIEKPIHFKSDTNSCFANADELVFPLTLRSWQKGDIFKPFGLNGEKKVSDFLIGEKIPKYEKKQIPILVNGDGRIIWICGLRSDDRFKVKSNTKKIIILEYIKN